MGKQNVIHQARAFLQKKFPSAQPLAWLFALFGVLLFGGMVAFVALSLYRQGSDLSDKLAHINPLAIGASFFLYSCALGLAILDWTLIARRLTNVQGLRHHFKVYCYANLARRIPGPFWYVVGRAYLYRREGVGLVSVSAASGLELVLIVLSGLVSYALLSLGRWPAQWTWGLILGLGVGLLLIHPRLLQGILDRMGHVDVMQRIRYRDVAAWLGIYVGVWVLGGLTLLSVVQAIEPIDLSHAPGVVASWSLSGAVSTLVVFLPAGLGVREATLSVLLLPFMPGPLAVTVALMMRVFLTLYEIFWALVAVLVN